tara:strand:+ start:6327 stop:6626 length:300 start_codon:yes stop_codon:yes gene_type:complete
MNDVIERSQEWLAAYEPAATGYEDAAATIIRDLLAVVEKLPVTADGVVVVPGMPLWGWVDRHDGTPGLAHRQNWMVWRVAEINRCYSTKATAEAARAKP